MNKENIAASINIGAIADSVGLTCWSAKRRRGNAALPCQCPKVIMICYRFISLIFLSATLFCHCAVNTNAQTTQTNDDYQAETDGIHVSLGAGRQSLDGVDFFTITFVFNPPNTNNVFTQFPTTTKLTNGIVLYHNSWMDGTYYRATNSFCGPVELRDSDGRRIDLRNPNLNSPNAYPGVYNLREEGRLLARLVGTGPSLPYVLVGNNPGMFFPLEKYFKIEKPGEYKLTVWPKIYKRASATNDVCKRIDFPPVTVPVQVSTVSEPKPGRH